MASKRDDVLNDVLSTGYVPPRFPRSAAGATDQVSEKLLYTDFACLLEHAAGDDRIRSAVWAACWRDPQAWNELQSLARKLAERYCTESPLASDVDAYWEAIRPTRKTDESALEVVD